LSAEAHADGVLRVRAVELRCIRVNRSRLADGNEELQILRSKWFCAGIRRVRIRIPHRLRTGRCADDIEQRRGRRHIDRITIRIDRPHADGNLVCIADACIVLDLNRELSADLLAAFQAREGAETLVYDIPATQLLQFAHDPGVLVSIWRSVGSSYNGFVVESFIDELAAAAGADPAAYRRDRLRQPRHLAVLDRLLELSRWGKPASGRAQGIALFESFDTVVGQVAEVSVDDGNIRVHRVTCVVECGRAITPDIVRQQMEGGIIFGLTAALYGELTFADGRVEQSNFHDYRMLRMADTPDIDVEVLDSDAPPTGVGEPGVPPIAAAVANAVFAATGERLRSLPLSPRGAAAAT